MDSGVGTGGYLLRGLHDATQLALPREGHLEAVLHIFSYLKSHHNTEMVFDPSDPMVDITDMQEKDWSTSVFGSELKEIIPSNEYTRTTRSRNDHTVFC